MDTPTKAKTFPVTTYNSSPVTTPKKQITPTKPTVCPLSAYVPPVKQALPNGKCCVACGKSTKGHLLSIDKNVALQKIYIELLRIIDIDVLPNSVEKKYICNSCIRVTNEIKDLRQKYENKMQTKETRVKRIIAHSPGFSPKLKKKNPQAVPEQNDQSKLKVRKSLYFKPFVTSETSSSEVNEDHSYARRSSSNIYRDHHVTTLLQNDRTLRKNEITLIKNLLDKLNDRISTKDFAKRIMDIPVLSDAIHCNYLLELDGRLDHMSTLTYPSVLRTPLEDLNDPSIFSKIVTELEKRCPRLLEILITMCAPIHRNISDNNFIVAAMYGMAMNSRNAQMCALQKILTATCVRHHAGNQVCIVRFGCIRRGPT